MCCFFVLTPLKYSITICYARHLFVIYPLIDQFRNYLSTITQKAKTVEDAIQITHDFDFGNSMSLQIHIADVSGDAVVISAGPDEELAFTRKEFGDGYLISTNFNLAIPEKRKRCWRYEKAKSMLNEVFESDKLSYEGMGGILEAVHLESLTSYTLYSNVFDLKDKPVAEIMDPPLTFVGMDNTIDVLTSMISHENQALLVRDHADKVHILTQHDLLVAMTK